MTATCDTTLTVEEREREGFVSNSKLYFLFQKVDSDLFDATGDNNMR